MFPLFAKFDNENNLTLFTFGPRGNELILDNNKIGDLTLKQIYEKNIVKKYNIINLENELNIFLNRLKKNSKVNKIISNDSLLNMNSNPGNPMSGPMSLILISNIVAMKFDMSMMTAQTPPTTIEFVIPEYTKKLLEDIIIKLNTKENLKEESKDNIEELVEKVELNDSLGIMKVIILTHIIKLNNFNILLKENNRLPNNIEILSEDEMKELIKETLSKDVETFIDMNDNNKIGIVILLGLIMIILWMKLNRMGQSFTLSNLSKLV
jgi:hypothetical protein